MGHKSCNFFLFLFSDSLKVSYHALSGFTKMSSYAILLERKQKVNAIIFKSQILVYINFKKTTYFLRTERSGLPHEKVSVDRSTCGFK